MQTRQSVKGLLVVGSVCAVVGSLLAAGIIEQTPGIPSMFNPKESAFQQQTHFLVFTSSQTAGENATTATAYYNAIDPPTAACPSGCKRNFTQWLKNAGFISDESQWHSTGPQLIACNLPGCDFPAGTYGDNIINTDSHAIVLNAADLGFVRNQFIRCVPSCSASNPIIYTYLENYPVNPFAASGNGGSGFPMKTGYPTTAEITAAMQSAINRPPGTLPGCDPTKTDTPFGCKISRIADVAFEWAPPPGNPTSSSRYGQIYAFIYNEADPLNITETIANPTGGFTPNVATHALEPFNAGDPFPPNLDFIGNKQNPGVCLICHGGSPSNLTSTGQYPNQGNINGFRFIPLDIRNLGFTSDLGPDQPSTNGSQAFTDRANQELQIKAYNLAVLQTVPSKKERDNQGTLRIPHVREVINGWYAGGRPTQDVDFIPSGWLEPIHGGTAPAGSENLYGNVFSPNCRSCHFNRELSLDLGTAAAFVAEKDNVLQLAIGPLCSASNPIFGQRPMPLAHLTYQKFWQANSTPEILPYPNNAEHPQLTIFDTAELIANFFGYSGTAAYCKTGFAATAVRK
jgi:hypothetical protein